MIISKQYNNNNNNNKNNNSCNNNDNDNNIKQFKRFVTEIRRKIHEINIKILRSLTNVFYKIQTKKQKHNTSTKVYM